MAAITILDTVPSAVPTPSSGKTSLFIDSNVMKVKTSTGTVITVGGGSVSSVDVSGGSTGLTFSGGPITSSGTITMGGALGTSYGGVPTGGATGQVLAKTGSGDYSVAWTTPAPGGVTSFNTRTGAITLSSTDVTDALGFTPGTGNGSVTSIDVSGGTTGLTFTGGPITTSGTITLGGALGTSYGGMPTGGSAGQILSKVDGTDYNTQWTARSPIYTASTTAPTSPYPGDTWTNTDTGITYEYFTDGDGSQWVQWNGTSSSSALPSALTTTSINNSGILVLPNASGNGIQLDNDTPAFGWNDLLGPITTKGTGATVPTFAAFIGNIFEYQFDTVGAPGSARTAYLVYHMPHDYVPGTDLYWHIHWAHNSASLIAGAITWKYEVSYAKGFNQQVFGATKIGTVTQLASPFQYRHMVAEGQLSVAGGSATQLDSNELEVDGIIILAFSCSDNGMTPATNPFVFTADIHYQSTGITTKNKSPNFYS